MHITKQKVQLHIKFDLSIGHRRLGSVLYCWTVQDKLQTIKSETKHQRITRDHHWWNIMHHTKNCITLMAQRPTIHREELYWFIRGLIEWTLHLMIMQIMQLWACDTSVLALHSLPNNRKKRPYFTIHETYERFNTDTKQHQMQGISLLFGLRRKNHTMSALHDQIFLWGGWGGGESMWSYLYAMTP